MWGLFPVSVELLGASFVTHFPFVFVAAGFVVWVTKDALAVANLSFFPFFALFSSLLLGSNPVFSVGFFFLPIHLKSLISHCPPHFLALSFFFFFSLQRIFQLFEWSVILHFLAFFLSLAKTAVHPPHPIEFKLFPSLALPLMTFDEVLLLTREAISLVPPRSSRPSCAFTPISAGCCLFLARTINLLPPASLPCLFFFSPFV